MERRRSVRRLMWVGLWVLVAIIVVFFVIRVATDVPNLRHGREIDAAEFEARYAAHTWVAYLHIVPGVVFVVGALHQRSRLGCGGDICGVIVVSGACS